MGAPALERPSPCSTGCISRARINHELSFYSLHHRRCTQMPCTPRAHTTHAHATHTHATHTRHARSARAPPGTLEIEEFAKLCRELREWQWAQGTWPRPPPPPKGASVRPKAQPHEEASWKCHLIAETATLMIAPVALPEGTRWSVSVWHERWHEQITTQTSDPSLQLNISSLTFDQARPPLSPTCHP